MKIFFEIHCDYLHGFLGLASRTIGLMITPPLCQKEIRSVLNNVLKEKLNITICRTSPMHLQWEVLSMYRFVPSWLSIYNENTLEISK